MSKHYKSIYMYIFALYDPAATGSCSSIVVVIVIVVVVTLISVKKAGLPQHDHFFFLRAFICFLFFFSFVRTIDLTNTYIYI